MQLSRRASWGFGPTPASSRMPRLVCFALALRSAMALDLHRGSGRRIDHGVLRRANGIRRRRCGYRPTVVHEVPDRGPDECEHDDRPQPTESAALRLDLDL